MNDSRFDELKRYDAKVLELQSRAAQMEELREERAARAKASRDGARERLKGQFAEERARLLEKWESLKAKQRELQRVVRDSYGTDRDAKALLREIAPLIVQVHGEIHEVDRSLQLPDEALDDIVRERQQARWAETQASAAVVAPAATTVELPAAKAKGRSKRTKAAAKRGK